jgi:hypothetical protein
VQVSFRSSTWLWSTEEQSRRSSLRSLVQAFRGARLTTALLQGGGVAHVEQGEVANGQRRREEIVRRCA